MPSKGRWRPLEEESALLAHWVDAVLKLMAEPGRHGSDGTTHHPAHKELILEAHRWGEAMVRAELEYRMAAGAPALRRLNAFHSLARGWYARGYRYYLRPTCKDAPKAIGARACANKWVTETVSDGYIGIHAPHVKAAELWWELGLHKEMLAEAQRAMEAETLNLPGPTPSPPRPAASTSTVTPVRRPIAGLAPSPVTQSAAKRSRTSPPLPKLLAKLLDEPAIKTMSKPCKDIAEHVTIAFHNLRPLRAWDRDEKGMPMLRFLEGDTHAMQLSMSERGLDALFGGLDVENRPVLERHGLVHLNGGGYNSIWCAKPESASLDALFPPVVVEPFHKGELVLRIPHCDCEEREGKGKPHALWLTFEEAVGEATNMLFTAMTGCGPRVAALAFARRIDFEAVPIVEGVPTVLYKLYAWLERGTMSVDERFAADRAHAPSTALRSRPYYDALLVAIARISNQGCLHCDATLRNFVDFYRADLFHTKACDAFEIKVIDVDASSFRRPHAASATTDWRHLFLFNLLTVLVFLKLKLEKHWDSDIYWSRVQPVCQQLISELPGTRTVASIAMWRGTFSEAEEFPCMTEGKYAGNTAEATAHAAMRYMKHYLLKQPIAEARKIYVEAVLPEGGGPQDPKRVRDAQAWYDHTYRLTVAPARAFFCKEYCGYGPPKRFVQVAYEFLDTPHSVLKDKFANLLPPTSEHRPNYDSVNYWLGLAR